MGRSLERGVGKFFYTYFFFLQGNSKFKLNGAKKQWEIASWARSKGLFRNCRRVEAAFLAAAASAVTTARVAAAAANSPLAAASTEFAFCFSERRGGGDYLDDDEEDEEDYYSDNYSGGLGGGGGGGGHVAAREVSQFRSYDDYDYDYDYGGHGGHQHNHGGGHHHHHHHHGGGGGGHPAHHRHKGSDPDVFPDYYTSASPFDKDQLYRDNRYHGRPSVIRNPRDRPDFPGIVPAGIDGISPKLFEFITTHVNQVSYYVQGKRRRRRRRRSLLRLLTRRSSRLLR